MKLRRNIGIDPQRLRLATALALAAGPFAQAQAPMLQDGASALRQAKLDWTLGQAPLPPSSLPSFEVGWGGADSEGAYTPLVGGEGLGHGTQGWGVALQGRYVRGGWSFSATALGLRHHGSTLGVLQRASLVYQWDSGWRAALEQTPIAWGAGLLGGDLSGDAARPFPRLSLATPEAALPFGRWRAEAFLGQLEGNRYLPDWLRDRDARIAARASGRDLDRPSIWGGLLRASFGAILEASFGAVTMDGGRDALGLPAPAGAARTISLAEVRVRIPALTRFAGARGASVHLSRSAAPPSRALTLGSGRTLAGLHLAWEGWDLAAEYAGAAPPSTAPPFLQPTHLADGSTRGDSLGSAFGRDTSTRTVMLGFPLFREGAAQVKLVRATSAPDHPSGTGSWFLQAGAQWPTDTGRFGFSAASRRNERHEGARWGWTMSLFQSFRVF